MNRRNRQLTAWIDGEGPLPQHAAGTEGRDALASARRIGDALREGAGAASDPGSHFNARILASIRTENLPAARPARDPALRLAWGGAGLLAAAALWTFTIVPRDPSVFAGRDYFAAVTRTSVAGEHLSAVPVAGREERNLTVVWIDGLEYQYEERRR